MLKHAASGVLQGVMKWIIHNTLEKGGLLLLSPTLPH